MAVAVAVLIVGSVLFHLLSPCIPRPWHRTGLPSTTAVTVTFWVTGAVFVAINSFMVYALIRYDRRRGGQATYEPEKRQARETPDSVEPRWASRRGWRRGLYAWDNS